MYATICVVITRSYCRGIILLKITGVGFPKLDLTTHRKEVAMERSRSGRNDALDKNGTICLYCSLFQLIFQMHPLEDC